MSEMLYEQGYAWVLPNPFESQCLTIVNSNFGEFVTGYTNVLIEATSTTDCQETLTIARAPWWTGSDMHVDLTI
jgi:hypothetical protein